MRNERCGQKGSNISVTPANYFLKLANPAGASQSVLRLAPVTSPARQYSKSKVFKKFAINLIKFCLKSGITENKDIIKFLKENEAVLKPRTFDRYKSIAEGELESDLDANIWLEEKVHTALIHDYKNICDRYDRQLLLDDLLIEGLIKKAIDEAE